MRALLLLSLLSLPLHADVLELRDGKKLSGKVSEKGGVYQIKIEGETLTFNQGEVSRWIRKPKELTGEADSLIAEAKKIYIKRLADYKYLTLLKKSLQINNFLKTR